MKRCENCAYAGKGICENIKSKEFGKLIWNRHTCDKHEVKKESCKEKKS